MIIRVVSSLNTLIEALVFSLFLSLSLSLGTMKLQCSGVVHLTKSTLLAWHGKSEGCHCSEWEFPVKRAFCPSNISFFQKSNLGVRLTYDL